MGEFYAKNFCHFGQFYLPLGILNYIFNAFYSDFNLKLIITNLIYLVYISF